MENQTLTESESVKLYGIFPRRGMKIPAPDGPERGGMYPGAIRDPRIVTFCNILIPTRGAGTKRHMSTLVAASLPVRRSPPALRSFSEGGKSEDG